ncbi:DUF1492 domain-containing protein [Anaerotignum sp. MB30-C6]|uniref:DUF1492 domain-containing protein n=1 Tax=Anaerotignum sp. MB30-C6 TaxID=3070814 RepID=UPI0027DD3C0D|nr:DUF1492 domain-containing protein [Anaerotignum sp. MB30-C6]WMI80917.1 DUF1492 domain-containing protein [Anaerotignum sp. MB30-C6]
MGKELLDQYVDLQDEIKDLKRRINKIKAQIERLESEGTVLDSVRGSRKDGTIGSIRIEGFPLPHYDEKLSQLYRYKAQLEKAEQQAVKLVNEIEIYINSIEDCRMRRIVRYRFIDKLSWNQVADRMGGNNTEDSIRKAVTRFLDKNSMLSDMSVS